MDLFKSLCSIAKELKEFLEWVKQKNIDLTSMIMQCSSDIKYLQQQNAYLEMLSVELDAKAGLIEKTILSAKNIGSQISSSPVEKSANSHDINELLNHTNFLTELLEKEWINVIKKNKQLTKQINFLLPAVKKLWEDIYGCIDLLQQFEMMREYWKPVGELPVEYLEDQLKALQEFQSTSVKPLIDQISVLELHASKLKEKNIDLSSDVTKKVDDILMRWKLFQVYCKERSKLLLQTIQDFGPNSQLFLNASVDNPWERVVTDKNVPYYMNHFKQTTSWDHPKMAELMESMIDLNDVRFTAYRTAMKLHRLQKALCLDLLNLNKAQEAFAHCNFNVSMNNTTINVVSVPDIINCLTMLYSVLEQDYSTLVNVPLCVDMCLNWILNVYDTKRQGKMDVLSFKIAIVSLCRASLEEKYRYLFVQITYHSGFADETKLRELLNGFMKIPWQLGEADAFGGTDALPSVSNCFQMFQHKPEIDVGQFVNWMKLEPQTVVWLPVLHRIISAENISHPTICAICKESPIVGLRYKSLRHFRYDVCQSCFFSGRVAMRNRFYYPLVEYCTPTSSTLNVKDFAKIIRNKLKGKSTNKYLGYLPIEADEYSIHFQKPDTSSATLSSTKDEEEINDVRVDDISVDSISLHTHSKIEEYARRLAEISLNSSQINDPNQDLNEEHLIILEYCESVNQFSSQDSVKKRNETDHIFDNNKHRHSAIFSQQEEHVPFTGSHVKPENSENPPSFEQSKRKSQYGLLDSAAENICDVDGTSNSINHEKELITTPHSSTNKPETFFQTEIVSQRDSVPRYEMLNLEDHNASLQVKLNELQVIVNDQKPDADKQINDVSSVEREPKIEQMTSAPSRLSAHSISDHINELLRYRDKLQSERSISQTVDTTPSSYINKLLCVADNMNILSELDR